MDKLNQIENIKCGLLNVKVLLFLFTCIILCCCMSLLIPVPSSCMCNGGFGCECGGKCGCSRRKCGCRTQQKRVQQNQSRIIYENFGNTDSEPMLTQKSKINRYTTRKFELLPPSTSENAPKNMLFGDGEFIFTGEKVYIFIMADLYVIGANLYASTQSPSDLSYNVYVGPEGSKFKLGELKRSMDGRYKMEFNSTSREFMDLLALNDYIQIRLEDVNGALDTVVLEANY